MGEKKRKNELAVHLLVAFPVIQRVPIQAAAGDDEILPPTLHVDVCNKVIGR